MTRLRLSITLFLFLTNTTIFAGAAVPKANDLNLFTSINYYVTTKNFDNDRNSFIYPDNGKFTKKELNYFLLYGIGNDLAVFAKGSVLTDLDYTSNTSNEKNTDFGENSIGLRKELTRSIDTVTSVQFSISFPLFDKEENPVVGAHQSDFDIRYLFDKYQLLGLDFISTELALNIRLGKPVNQFKFDLSFGKSFSKFLIMFHSYLVMSLNPSDEVTSLSPLDAQDWDQLKTGPSIVYKLSNTYSFQVGYLAEVWGRNIGKGHLVFTSVWLDF